MFQHENTSQLLGNQVTSNQGVHVAGASFAHKADNTLDTLDNDKSDESGVHDKKEESDMSVDQPTKVEPSSKIATAFSAQPSHKQEEPTRYDSVELDNDPNRIEGKESKPSLIDRIADKLGIHSSDDKDKAQDHSSKTDRLSSKHTDTKNERDNDPNHDEADSPGFFDKIKSKLGIKSDDKTDKKDTTDDMDENSPGSHDQQGIIEVGTFPIFPGELTSIPTVDEDEVPDSPFSTDNVKTTVDSDKSDDHTKNNEASDPLRVSLPAETQVKEGEQLQKKPQATKKVSFSSTERDHETFDEFPATKPGHKHVAHQIRPSDPPDQDLSTIVPISTPQQADASSVYSSNLLDYNTGGIVTGNHNTQEGHHTLTTHRSDPTNNATGRSVTEVAL